MIPVDLLELTSTGRLPINDAFDVVDEAVAANHGGGPFWWDSVGFTELEARAYLHGATIRQLTRVRKDGWPDSCSGCGLPINASTDHWFFDNRDDRRPALRHITCLTPSDD